MTETDSLDPKDPRTLFKLWKELTGEDFLNEEREGSGLKEKGRG